MGRVPPDEVPYWINADNAVLVPSAAEGFGLAVIEALACGVPAFGTPTGIHHVALHGIDGAYCAEWDRDAWRAEEVRRFVAACRIARLWFRGGDARGVTGSDLAAVLTGTAGWERQFRARPLGPWPGGLSGVGRLSVR